MPWNVVDPEITLNNELPLFAEFVSGYFQHGNLSTRNADVLNFQAHGFSLRPPSVYSIAAAGRASIIELTDSVKLDIPLQFFLSQALASYETLYDKNVLSTLPNMKTFLFCGEHSPAFAIHTAWEVQNDDLAHGGGFIKVKILNGLLNHLVCLLPQFVDIY